MFKLSQRCIDLRDIAVNYAGHDRIIDGQHPYWFVKGYYEMPTGEFNRYKVKSVMLVSKISNCDPYIFDKELIVGYTLSSNIRNDGIEYAVPITNTEQEATVRASFKDTLLTEVQIDEYIYNLKNNNPPFPSLFDGNWGMQTKYMLTPDEIALCEDYGAMGHCIAICHSVIGYDSVVKYGFEGLLNRINKYSAINGDNDFYRCIYPVCEAACHLGERYAERARLMAEINTDETRRRELFQIAETCSVVPRYPAKSFRQAVQAVWIAHCINTWEDGIVANSIGRLDQILYPYYQRDIDNGVITKEEAFELICCLWLKLYRDYDVQQICIGGCDKNGNDAVNDLSYLMLDATEALNFVRDLSVRYSQKTDRKFIRRAFEVVGHIKKGIPFFFNDDVLIPSLSDNGIELEDARGYAALGCVEINIPGKSHNHAVVGQVNMIKPVLYALTNGISIIHPGHFCGCRTGDPKNFDTFDKFKEAVKIHIKRAVAVTCKGINHNSLCAAGSVIAPVKSLLTEGCIEKGRDFNDGGPKYVYYQVCLIGIPNLIDSLMVIKDMVYDKKRYTINEIIYYISNNFPIESVRQEFINNVPKYGNDITEVNELAKEMYGYACDCVNNEKPALGDAFHAEPFSFTWMINHGQNTGATPDGRRNGEILAYSMSPMQGCDHNGFTALLNSIACMPTKKAPGASSAILELAPYYFEDQNLDKLINIFMAASETGLSNTQFNIVSRETLIDAQNHPDKYQNLAVRVSGFSQKFILLSPELQNHIIARTKHSVL